MKDAEMSLWVKVLIGVIGGLFAIAGALSGFGVAGVIQTQRDLVNAQVEMARELGGIASRMTLMEEGKSTPKAKDTIEAFQAVRERIEANERTLTGIGLSVQVLSDRVGALAERVGKIEVRQGVARESKSEGILPLAPGAAKREPLPPFKPAPPVYPDKVGG